MDIGTNACSEERAAAGQIPLPLSLCIRHRKPPDSTDALLPRTLSGAPIPAAALPLPFLELFWNRQGSPRFWGTINYC